MKLKLGLIMGVLLLLVLPGMAVAEDYWSVGSVGIMGNYAYKDYPGSAKTPKDCFVQYIWTKDGYIDGPVAGTNGIHASDQLMFTQKVGYDKVNMSDPGDGRFLYGTDTEGPATVPANVNRFLVRIWWKSGTGGAAGISDCDRFGEGVFSFPGPKFITISNPKPTPDQTEIGKVNCVLPTQAPGKPTPAAAASTQGRGSTPPTVTVTFSTKLGTRYFKVELFRDANYTTQFGSTVNQYYESGWHQAAVADGSSDRACTFNLTTADDKRYFYWRVKTVNSFGESDWVTGDVWVPENADPYVPVAVTDLKAEAQASSLKLNWSAPYDLNKIGSPAPCASYDIKVSTEAIVDVPQSPFSATQTNPGAISNWSGAVPVNTYFSGVTVPTPSQYGSSESVTIPTLPVQRLYFAVKSKDASGNISYISNVAGYGTGEGGTGGPQEITISLIKKADGMGINTVGIPFDAPFTIGRVNINTLQDLINAINAAVNKNIVSAVSYWDESSQNLEGAAFDDSGKRTYSTAGLKIDTVLKGGKAYYFSVTDNASITMKK